MFTGIISDTTSLRLSKTTDQGLTLTFKRPAGWSDLQAGESINSNGICLTVADLRAKEYDCVVVPETINRTSFGKHLPGTVNLERALQLNGRLDGHFVQGHVDAIGRITAIDKSDGQRLTISFDPKNRQLVVEKGSITVDGISLTIAALTDTSLSVALVPYTLEHTTAKAYQVGDLVNIEFDIIGKYILGSLQTALPQVK